MKGCISVRKASHKQGVSERCVNKYCQENRVEGLSKFGRSWAIPENAKKPTDPRKGGGGQ